MDVVVNPVSGYVYVANYYTNTIAVLSGTSVITYVPTGHDDCGWSEMAVQVEPILNGAKISAIVDIEGAASAVTANPSSGYVYVTSWGYGGPSSPYPYGFYYPGSCVVVLSDTQIVATV